MPPPPGALVLPNKTKVGAMWQLFCLIEDYLQIDGQGQEKGCLLRLAFLVESPAAAATVDGNWQSVLIPDLESSRENKKGQRFYNKPLDSADLKVLLIDAKGR